MAVYGGEWSCYADVAGVYPDVPAEQDVVYAAYETGSYDGSAVVVFVRDGKLWENHDSHCSCNGLEDWRPEETTAAAIMMRPDDAEVKAALVAWIGQAVEARAAASAATQVQEPKARAIRVRAE